MFGWQRSFNFCTDAAPFRNIDKDTAKKIDQYTSIVHGCTTGIDPTHRMKILGITSLTEQFTNNSAK